MAIHLKEHENSTTQALTEVALALSMAFFSLLILTLISMGVPAKSKLNQQLDKEKTIDVIQDNKAKSDKAGSLKYVIYYHGDFYDAALKRIKPNKFNSQERLILAIESTLSISEVIAIKTQINNSNLSITTLNNEWLSRLEKK
ncbi:hypothetical protein CJF42_06705 [Pseudoalteromonas sp. NBT06-2]|uniref:hypothetical protein n=1 Tax=Pseudoalteromonas sp. NBT06-2 TaxID=2025950 RepID=UPI000BA6527D|nr:hypothetical protein [Pseudoalteromonas sp. NBT06-2]PAJ75175.1 hypothetical protein CJF42_06705 [Pseudoalteromonas sp. NBT06-2]